ncbi:MAG: tetratricopeptide repeat protein [Acidiferrobacterales bacterium]|nr:tetratricopeptide repeat protein [Acidiferrobacterales bacterium]
MEPIPAATRGRHASPLIWLALAVFVSAPPAPSADDRVTQGIRLFERQQYEEAQIVLTQAVAANNADPVGQYYLGRTYFMLCDYDQAIMHLERAVDLGKNEADYHFWLGRAYGEKAQRSGMLKQAGLAKKIRAAFEHAVALDSKHVGARTGLGNFYAQAPRFMGGGLDKATDQAKALVALDPLKGELLNARILEEQEEPNRAEAIYKELQERHGNSASAFDLYGEYGRFLLRQGRIDQAIGELEKQVGLKADSLSAHFDLAAAYKAAGRSQDATNEYAKAAKINPRCEPPKKQYREKK